MKEWKNKEVILGLIILIILCTIALGLIIKREFPQNESVQTKRPVVEDTAMAGTADVVEEAGTHKGADPAREELRAQQNDFLEREDKTKAELGNSKQMKALGMGAQADDTVEFYTNPVYAKYTGVEIGQLEELYYYWNDYKLEAVDDLIRLPRLRTAFTNELTGTNQFYYYGSLNSDGIPHGNGLAVYENNAYYCGEWKNGKRHGKGMWLQIYPDKPSVLNGASGVIEHSYNGQWQNDFPNGEGQEHISYDLDEMEGEDIITNVIGSFKDGYYDGELYIMTLESENKSTDWEAVAEKGTFSYYHERYNGSGELPVWKKMIHADEDEFRWLSEFENRNWGIFGLKKIN